MDHSFINNFNGKLNRLYNEGSTMLQVQFTVRYDLPMEMVSSFISLLIGYYSFKGYKTTENRGFFLLYIGFVVLGLSMLFRVVSTVFVLATLKVAERGAPILISISRNLGVVYSLMRIFSYFVFSYLFIKQAKESLSIYPGFVSLPFLVFNANLELLAIVPLSYIVFQTLLNWVSSRSLDGFLVFLGFLLMAASHLFFIFSIIRISFYLIGHFLQLIGFISLLTMLIRVSREK